MNNNLPPGTLKIKIGETSLPGFCSKNSDAQYFVQLVLNSRLFETTKAKASGENVAWNNEFPPQKVCCPERDTLFLTLIGITPQNRVCKITNSSKIGHK
jgi:hypothetical protein